MNTEQKKLTYLSDHGWKPRKYTAMNRTNVVWYLQIGDEFNKLESTLNMLEISMMEFKSLVRHCEYIEKRMKSDLKRREKWNLTEAR